MNLRYAPTSRLRQLFIPVRHLSSDRRRWTLRAAWSAVIALLAVIFVTGIPVIFTQLRTGCTGDACQQWQAAPGDLVALHSLGLSTDKWATTFILVDALVLASFWTVATALFWNRADDRMGLFCAVMLLVSGSVFSQTLRAAGSRGSFSMFPIHLSQFLSLTLLITFFYVFPDGRFVPRWTRWLALICVMGGALVAFAPWATWVPSAVAIPVICLGLAILLGSGIVAQVYRYRRVSTLAQRLQMKWPVSGFAAAVILFAGLAALFAFYLAEPPSLPHGLRELTFLLLAYNGWRFPFVIIPFCIGAAVLRHRLFDIDIIINRTLVYGGLTAGVIAFYVLVVGYLSAVFRTEDNVVISLVATGLVAVLFQPLRERFQRAVNRVMYGERDDPYAVLSGLGRRLEATLAPATLLPTIVETTMQALKLPYAAIVLREADGFVTAASCGTPVDHPLVLPLNYQGEVLGQLMLAARAPGEPFSTSDRRLLDDLARHTGIAVSVVRLTTDLQRSRERLVTAREEERRRLRRDLHDGLGPTLASLFQRLDVASTLAARDPAATVAMLDDLKAQVKTAIADIRRLVYALRPPALDEYGLVASIRQHAAQIEGVNGLHVELVTPETLPPLSAAVEVAAYRIALEALTNVTRHSGARSCRLEIQLDGVLALEITDDGGGLPAHFDAGVGVTSMRERAAELGGDCRIESLPEGGTRVLAHLPVAGS